MREYTSEELKRGRFLRHFMGLDQPEPTVEEEAVSAEASPPPTRVIQRPRHRT
jgi:hypothetical protein